MSWTYAIGFETFLLSSTQSICSMLISMSIPDFFNLSMSFFSWKYNCPSKKVPKGDFVKNLPWPGRQQYRGPSPCCSWLKDICQNICPVYNVIDKTATKQPKSFAVWQTQLIRAGGPRGMSNCPRLIYWRTNVLGQDLAVNVPPFTIATIGFHHYQW